MGFCVFSGPRVRLLVAVPESFYRDVGVNLRGRQ